MAVDHLRPAMNNNILLFTGFFINYSRRNPDYRNYHDNVEHDFPEVNGGKERTLPPERAARTGQHAPFLQPHPPILKPLHPLLDGKRNRPVQQNGHF